MEPQGSVEPTFGNAALNQGRSTRGPLLARQNFQSSPFKFLRWLISSSLRADAIL